VASAPAGAVVDDDGLRAAFRRMFQTAEERLRAAGSSLHDTAEMLTFHGWDTERYAGTKLDRLRILAEVKHEFIPAPHPAWTAVGVTELLPDRGLIEMRIVAYSPQR